MQFRGATSPTTECNAFVYAYTLDLIKWTPHFRALSPQWFSFHDRWPMPIWSVAIPFCSPNRKKPKMETVYERASIYLFHCLQIPLHSEFAISTHKVILAVVGSLAYYRHWMLQNGKENCTVARGRKVSTIKSYLSKPGGVQMTQWYCKVHFKVVEISGGTPSCGWP